MKCPKCQTEINNNARFCTKCGCNLAVEVAKAVKPSTPARAAACGKCGAVLNPGAKFCTKCGQAVTAADNQSRDEDRTMFLYNESGDGSDDSQTVVIDNNDVSQRDQPHNINPVPGLDEIVPPDNQNRKQKKAKGQQNQNGHKEKEKTGKGLIAAVVVLLVLVIVSGVACYMVWNGTVSLPAFAGGNTGDKEEESSSIGEETGEDPESVPAGTDTTALFAEADALLAEGKNQITIDAEVLNGMDSIHSAMNQFADKAQEAGDAGLAADRIADAYASYVEAVTRHKDMMNAQELSGAIYNQIMSEIGDAEALAGEMSAKGYTVDTATLAALKDTFHTSYSERIINEFDDFTNRAAWSRTEAWNLMSGFDGVFDGSDLDNPLRLRYAYALSWWIQRQVETDLASGMVTEKGAAVKIASMIEAMDYNPMMLNYYITYMNTAGEDCTQVSEAYDEIVQHIAETQGIQIGEDIALDHFWYFNDFGAYSVDDTNGVTPENRQWIRDRMRSVVFAQ